MENKKLIQELGELITSKGLKKSEVEEKIGLPLNSLSNFLSGRKELPEKWSNPIRNFIDTKPKTMLDEIIEDRKQTVWVKKIESFCEKEGIIPQDLTEAYQNKKRVYV